MWNDPKANIWFDDQAVQYKPNPQNAAQQYVTFEKLTRDGRSEFYRAVSDKQKQRGVGAARRAQSFVHSDEDVSVGVDKYGQ